MTLSTISITNHDLISVEKAPRPILISLLVNYAIMGGISLLLAKWLINDPEIWAGFVTLAAMPPAISIVPFSYMLGGNAVFSLIGTTGLYLIALGLTPGIMLLLLDSNLVSPVKILITLVELIVVPLAISRLLLRKGLASNITKWRDPVINWCIFIVVFTIIGINRQVFFSYPSTLLKITLIAAVTTFGLGQAIELVTRRLHIDRATTTSLMLMGSKKNTGLASVIALAFFGERAVIPVAITTLFSTLYTVWLGFYLKRPTRIKPPPK
ncbi:MAG: hypothetical protein J7K77_04910 [Dehalococcoidales bacterium]|nr:hypothetical protein [Dehalococcoidales bacterium]